MLELAIRLGPSMQAYLNPAAKDARARQAVALGDAKTLRNYLEESQHRDGVGAAGVVGGRSAWWVEARWYH